MSSNFFSMIFAWLQMSVSSVFSRFRRYRRTLRGKTYVALPRLFSETGRDLEQSRLFFEHL